jgi:UDP-glucose/GDP-mannose dehydrogenase family, central domain
VSVRSRPPSGISVVGSGAAGAAMRGGLPAAEHGVSSVDTSAMSAAQVQLGGLDAQAAPGGEHDLAHSSFNVARTGRRNETRSVARRVGRDLADVGAFIDAQSPAVASAKGSFRSLHAIRGGAPYGGVCLPQETRGFVGIAAEFGVGMPLLRTVVDVNDHLKAMAVAVQTESGVDVA